MAYRKCLLFLCPALCIIAGYPSDAQVRTGNRQFTLKFRQLLGELSQSNVKCFAEDSLGFMWIGTEGGLNRYDGINVTQYKASEEPGGLPDSRIQALMIDSHNTLWVATYNALARFDHANDGFVVYENPDANGQLDALSIFETDNGDLWIGSLHGMLILEKNQQKIKRQNNTPFSVLDSSRVNVIYEDADGVHWFGTSEGLYRYQRGADQVTKVDLVNANVTDVVQVDRDRYWVGTETAGLFAMRLLPNGGIDAKNYNTTSLGDDRVFDIHVDRQNRLWIGTENAGLNLYNPESDSFIGYKKDTGMPGALKTNSIWEVFEDSAGRLWLGSNYQGAFVRDPYSNVFNHIHQGEGEEIRLKFNGVSCFQEIGNKVWIGTDGGGISIWDRQTNRFDFLSHNPNKRGSLASDEVLSMYKDNDGDLWVGNWEGGLHRYLRASNTFEVFHADDNNPTSIGSNSVFAIDEDGEGNLWMATWKHGVSKYNKSTNSFTHIGYQQYTDSLLSSDLTYDVEVDNVSHDLWVATVLGLDRVHFLSPEKFRIQHYNEQDSANAVIVDGFVRCIFQDSRNNIWVGSISGLFFYHREDNAFARYTVDEGLTDNDVKSIVEDDNGGIWISTNAGVSFINEIQEPFVFENFDEIDGLQGGEFFGSAAYKTKDGEIFLGGVNGFNYFFPEQIKRNPVAPQLQFTKLSIFNEEVEFSDENTPLRSTITTTTEIELAYDQSVFSIEYVGINFTHPENNSYAFKLDGFEDNWNNVGNRTLATYTNLDPGTYVFRVKAANHHGVWSAHEKILTIHILPPWWLTWWAKLLYIVSPVLLFVGIYRVRVSLLTKQKAALEAEVLKRTKEISVQNKMLNEMNAEKDGILGIVAHDLRTPFNNISGLIKLFDVAGDVNEEQTQYVDKIDYSIAQGKQLINDLLDISNFQHKKTQNLNFQEIDINGLFEELQDQHMKAIQEKNQQLSFHSNIDGILISDRLLLVRLLNNLITNAIKYSAQGKSIVVTASFEEHTFTTTVKDEGLGFSEEDNQRMFGKFQRLSARPTGGEHSTGLGLSIVKMIVDKLNGTITVHSKLGVGSEFIITLPTTPPSPVS